MTNTRRQAYGFLDQLVPMKERERERAINERWLAHGGSLEWLVLCARDRWNEPNMRLLLRELGEAERRSAVDRLGELSEAE